MDLICFPKICGLYDVLWLRSTRAREMSKDKQTLPKSVDAFRLESRQYNTEAGVKERYSRDTRV